MRYLTTTERENLTSWAARNKPEIIGYRDRVRVVSFPAPQPEPMTKVEFDDHVKAIAGDPATMPPGPVLNIARREQRRRQQFHDALAVVWILVGFVVGAAALLWFAGVLVDVFWTRS